MVLNRKQNKIIKSHFQCALKHCIVAVEKLQKEVEKIRDKAILATSEQQYAMSESIYPSPGHWDTENTH